MYENTELYETRKQAPWNHSYMDELEQTCSPYDDQDGQLYAVKAAAQVGQHRKRPTRLTQPQFRQLRRAVENYQTGLEDGADWRGRDLLLRAWEAVRQMQREAGGTW